MDDEDIEYLQECLRCGLIVWCATNSGWMRVVKIAEAPPPLPGEEPEPAEVAYLDSAHGNYSALAASGREDFMITGPEMAKWPRKHE